MTGIDNISSPNQPPFDIECADITGSNKYIKNSRKVGIHQTKSFIVGGSGSSTTNTGRPFEEGSKKGIKEKQKSQSFKKTAKNNKRSVAVTSGGKNNNFFEEEQNMPITNNNHNYG